MNALVGQHSWDELDSGFFYDEERRITKESESDYRLWDVWSTRSYRVGASTLIEAEGIDDLAAWRYVSR